ncbi:hypothetical protein 2203_scaffold802_00049 [Bacteriophage sp.]|nr:hypothetical protein 2203_scaffold802_00049 [Bacteriophage sp.]
MRSVLRFSYNLLYNGNSRYLRRCSVWPFSALLGPPIVRFCTPAGVAPAILEGA